LPEENSQTLVLGIDVGGTRIKAAVCNSAGSIVRSMEIDTRAQEGFERVMGRVISVARDLIAKTRSAQAEVKALGVGVPGRIDPRAGICFFSPNLPTWEDVQVLEPLREELGLPVWMENDANCAGLAELRFGAAKDAQSMVMFTLGTGVGGAVAMNDRLLTGPRNVIGEIGHTVVDPDGPLCGCGAHGCLEAFCGAHGISDRAAQRLQRGEKSIILDLVDGETRNITPHVVVRAAAQGDAVATAVLEETGMYLGIAIVNATVFVDPDVVVIGGRVALAGPVLFDAIRRTVRARCRIAPFDVERIVPAELGADAGAVGAAALALDGLATL